VANVFKFLLALQLLLARPASIKWMLLATRNFHSPLASGGFPHWCLDNAFDLVNRIWRYSGNQINTVVFMICLKKELLHAYTFSSSISVLCVITLWQRSNAWQGQSSVQDKFCSKQTQPLLQTDLPLHTRSCKKSDDLWQASGFLQFPSSIKLTDTIKLKYCWKWH
jgi:hypothetical protein